MLGNYSNYIHLFVGAETKYYTSIVMQVIKGINQEKPLK